MRLITEPYLTQVSNWPKNGRHILAQYDDHSIVVYQAYRPAIGHFAATYGYFGGEFSFDCMSWLKEAEDRSSISKAFSHQLKKGCKFI